MNLVYFDQLSPNEMTENTSGITKQDFTHMVNTYGDELFRRAHFKTGNTAVAEDLVQETFLSAYKSLGAFRKESSVKTWLHSILNNKVIDHYRKMGTRAQHEIPITTESHNINSFDKDDNWKANGLESLWEQEENILDSEEFISMLDNCLNDLPSAWREVMLMKFRLEKKAEEICNDCNLTTSNYWQIIHRAKLNLKKCLEVKWFSTLI
jgi:RNA polymerase sigma-70 factor (ECF subfamily)